MKILTPYWQRLFKGDFMRLTKLIKKLALLLMVVGIVGMLTACSSPTSSSGSSSGTGNNNQSGKQDPNGNGDNNNQPGNQGGDSTSKPGTNSSIDPDKTYTVLYGYYGENHIGDKSEETGETIITAFDEYDFLEGKDYVVSGTTIRITALGLSKTNGGIVQYDLMYNKNILRTLSATVFSYLSEQGLKEGTDYTVDDENLIVTILTESAYDTIVKEYPDTTLEEIQ